MTSWRSTVAVMGVVVAAALAAAPAESVTKTLDRKFPLTFCPLDLNGWHDGGNSVNLSFFPPSSSVRITLSAPNYYNGVYVNTHIDNVSVVLKAQFPDTAANVHAPIPGGDYEACYTPPGTPNAPSFLFNNFTWPGTAGPLLNLFDSSVECWTGDVSLDTSPSFLAPRNPATEGDKTGGSLKIGAVERQETVSASRIVTGLNPSQEYVVFAWWHAEEGDTPLTIAIESAACLDPDGDGFVDCSGCAPCELQAGQTCGDCNESEASIHPTAPDVTCDGIDQNCSGAPDEGFPGGCQCSQRAADIVGWWPGEGNAQDLIGPNDGTLTGPGVTFTGIGIVGQAFYFAYSQTGGIELPQAAVLDFTSQMTLEAWIRADEMTESSRPIISKLGSVFDYAYDLRTQPGGLLEAAISSNGTDLDILDSPAGVLNPGVWAHVATTFEAGAWKLYVNGEVVASKTSTITSIYDQGSARANIGRSPDGSLEFVGFIDEPAMYQRALTGDEVRAIYQAGAVGMCACADADQDGYGIDGLLCPGGTQLDCDDASAAIHPGVPESCNNLDDDCDGGIDNGLPIATYHRDLDNDGYGHPAVTAVWCAAPPGYVADSTDCNDSSASVYPGAAELCNGVDDNCNGQFDDGFPQSAFYRDADNDGYGNTLVTLQSCAAPSGYVADSTDCNDANHSISPGAPELCNLIDDNCNTIVDQDFESPPDGWIPTALAQAPSPRIGMTMVATSNSVIVWGGLTTAFPQVTNTGGIHKPTNPATDYWTLTSTGTNVPEARYDHTAVWTGTEMIVWGGLNSSAARLQTGGRYNLAGNSWTATSTGTNVPAARAFHTAVWTGSKMIIWGGFGSSTLLNTGALYDSSTNTWAAMSTAGAPAPRRGHIAVWTGTEMIVWGGWDGGTGYFSDGARYNPATNLWTPMASPGGLLTARRGHTAVWIGTQMVVWGGVSIVSGTSFYKNDGAIYSPATNSWVWAFVGLTPREGHTAVWDPESGLMAIWGGYDGFNYLSSGGIYNPVSHLWSNLPPGGVTPQARSQHAATWLSATREMLVWGGGTPGSYLSTGGRIVVAPFTCGLGECQRPSGFTCASGALGYGCTPGTPAAEVCNGLDDNCDGTADNGIPAPSGSPVLSVAGAGPPTPLSWSAVPGVTGYDVVGGDLGSLRSSGGDFTTSTSLCLGNDLAATTVQDGAVPPSPGSGVWYLVRPVDACGGNGSYDDGSAGQQGSRDAEIAASGPACP